MNDVPPTDAQAPSPERGIVKSVLDLQAVIEAMLSSLPASKAWQRQLRVHLAETDRCLQVLRLTISMTRTVQDVRQAPAGLCKLPDQRAVPALCVSLPLSTSASRVG